MSRKKSALEARQLLARNVRLLRIERNWTQENLADRAGLHRTSISQIERGVVNVSIDKFDLLADAFGIPLHWLFDTHALGTGRGKSKFPGVEEEQAGYRTACIPSVPLG